MFHVNDPAVGVWGVCTGALNYTTDYQKGSIYTYPYLIERGLRIWIYSGDTDGSVPTLGTRKWIKSLNLEVLRTYSQWFLPGDSQVSGYVVDYYGLTFLTIKGTGHMSIQWKRPQGFHFFNTFLQGGRL